MGLLAQGRGEEASRYADEARGLLEQEGGRPEAASAQVARAFGLAISGDFAAAESQLADALTVAHDLTHAEAQIEGARLYVWFGSSARAETLLQAAESPSRSSRVLAVDWLITASELEMAKGNTDGADALLRAVPDGPYGSAGQLARVRALQARLAVQSNSSGSRDAIRHALDHARLQHANLWVEFCSVLEALQSGAARPDLPAPATDAARAAFDMLADLIVARLPDLSGSAEDRVATAASRMPSRWLPVLRSHVDGDDRASGLLAARVLDRVGEQEDVARLRRFVAHSKLGRPDKELGRALARSLAPRVIVEDLGRTTLRVGKVAIPGTSVRRKVMALLLFLVSRPGYAATKDQVLDALWPEQTPDEAVNSLNQTAYFLRRVFEPAYKETTSPGYLHHASDMLWLDEELVSSRAAQCHRLIAESSATQDPGLVDALSESYSGLFGLDFAYEEWSTIYRDALHAGYLEAVEKAVLADIDRGDYTRASALTRRALDVEPASEPLQRLLVRITRSVGAFAAAAERYESYSSLVRNEYGQEPPPIEEL
jgi:DNA-binding SARP family transcriptional activator